MDARTITTTADTARAWDAAAPAWDRHTALLNTWLRSPTAAMLDAAAVGPGARVLDVAAGAGDQTLATLRRVGASGHVLATDISATALALARSRVADAGFAGLAARVADAQALGAALGDDEPPFDAVICRLGLMFCTQPLAALRGAWAALRPGGRYAALVFSGPAGNPCIATMVSTALRHAGRPPTSPFEPGTLMSLGQPAALAALLQGAGFVDVEVHALAAPMPLPGVADYIHFVKTAGLPIMALLAPLTATAQAEAWRDIEQQLARFATGDGWVGPNELLLGSGRRP
jgi:ubiquinone/menaquinone biosynthesis C-methylase UbiE